MADDSDDTASVTEAGENVIAFGGERDRGDRANDDPTKQPASALEEIEPASTSIKRSFDAGDLPEGMETRYLIERRRLTGEQRYFENATDTKPAFRDRGDCLIADNESRALIRDMVDIAEHRGWDRIRVSGSEEFRRAAWREAALRGIEVDGYRPKPRELQEIARTLAEQEARTARGTRSARDGNAQAEAAGEQGRGRRVVPARVDFDAGLSGRLADIGEAPYGGRPGGKVTPYADIDLDDGRRKRAWGVGLPAALRESGVTVGDQVTLRRLGTERLQIAVEVLNPETGERGSEVRDVNRNRWSAERSRQPQIAPVERESQERTTDRRSSDQPSGADQRNPGRFLADRFRDATSADAARDPRLQAAQSQFVAAKAIVTATLGHDPAAAQRLIDRSRETIAQNIENGTAIPPAELRAGRVVRQDRDRQPPERAKGNRGDDPVPNVTKAPTRSRQR